MLTSTDSNANNRKGPGVLCNIKQTNNNKKAKGRKMPFESLKHWHCLDAEKEKFQEGTIKVDKT